MIDPNCRVKSVIMEAYQNAAFLCEEYYDYAPDFEIKGKYHIELRLGGKPIMYKVRFLATAKKLMSRILDPRVTNKSWIMCDPNMFHHRSDHGDECQRKKGWPIPSVPTSTPLPHTVRVVQELYDGHTGDPRQVPQAACDRGAGGQGGA